MFLQKHLQILEYNLGENLSNEIGKEYIPFNISKIWPLHLAIHQV